jgi:hypothetical protein
MNEHAPQPQPSDDGRRGSGGVPRELRGVARLLDRAGDDASRRLGADGLDRIFAASDLQRPLGLAEVAPVAPRRDLHPRRRSILGPLARIPRAARPLAFAAALSMVALSAVVLYLATRPTAESLREGGAGGTMIADGALDRGAGSGPDAGVVPPAAGGLPEHFDEALQGVYAVATRSQPMGEVVVAFAGGSAARRAAPEAALATGAEHVFDAATFLDAGGATYDDLSSEMASILASTGGLGR